MLSALAHHPQGKCCDHTLDLYIWDKHTTGIEMPDLPMDLPFNEGWHYDQGRYFALALPFQNSSIWLDRVNNDAIYYSENLENINLAELSAPFLFIWSAWLSKRNLLVAHAAALQGRRGALLLIGAGGSGKSSTALKSLRSNLTYLADDYCLIKPAPEPTVFSLFSSGKVFIKDRDLYPELESAVVGDNGEKVIYQFSPTHRQKLGFGSPITAIMAVSRTASNTTAIVPLSPIASVKRMAPNTLLQVRYGSDSKKVLKALVTTIHAVQCLDLRLGTDRDHVIQVLENFLQ